MELDDIKTLCSTATPGPWLASSAYPAEGIWYANTPETKTKRESEANAEFIAAARTLLPKLLAVAEAAEQVQRDRVNRCNNIRTFERLNAALAALKADK